MKRIFSLILVLFIIFGSFNSTFAFANSDEIPLEEYASQLSALTKQYGVDSIGGTSEDTEINISEIPLNRIIVKTDDNNPLADDCGAIAKVEGYNGFHIMQYTSPETTNQAYEYFSSLSNVEFVEFDFFFEIIEPEQDQGTEIFEYDKEYLSWGSSTVCSNEAVACANSLAENAPEIVVAVIDSGIDYTHSFFEGRIVNSGVDLIENDGDPYDDYDKGHGTHVAGIVVDNTAENVKVSAYKTINSKGGGYYSVTCTAVDLAVKNNVDVINMSLGWENTEDCYNAFENSINNAVNNNIAVVVSAGNDYFDASKKCPASNGNVITVAATDDNNEPASFSNYGDCVDVAAPGFSINSTFPNNKYVSKNGTSMAAPFVSAAAAMIKSVNPNITPDEVEELIKNTAYVPDGWDTNYGVGIVNFMNILNAMKTVSPKVKLDSGKATLTANSANTQIYYTTDGTDPVIGESELYTAPFSVRGIDKIKAIACAEGLLPSDIMTFNMSEEISQKIVYKSTAKLDTLYNSQIRSIYSTNQDVVTVDIDGNIYGASKGNADVVMTLENGVEITYHINVYYDLWQWIIIILLFGFIWYI